MSEAYRLSSICKNYAKKVILGTDNSIRELYSIKGFKNGRSINVHDTADEFFNTLLNSKEIKELKGINDLILLNTKNKLAFDINSCITKIDNIVVNEHELIDYPHTFYTVGPITFIRFLKGKNVIDLSSDYIIFSENNETSNLVDKLLKGVFYKKELLDSIINEKTCETVIGLSNDKTKILTYDSTTVIVNENVNTVMPGVDVNTVILEDNTKTVFPEDETKTVFPENETNTLMPVKTKTLNELKEIMNELKEHMKFNGKDD